MANPVGSLVVRIGADVGGLQKGGRRAESTMQRMGRQARSTANSMAKIGGAAAAAGAAVTAELTRRGMEAVTAQRRLAQSIGTTQREVAGLTAAFETYKLQQDDVADALGTLADRAQDAANGQKSMAEDFELVGLQVENLKGKRPAELFRQFSAAVADTEDPTKRTAAAVRIFGDDLGRKLMPLLMRGPEALRDYRREAAALGVAVSGIEASQVESANRSIERMQQVLSGVQNQLAVALAPYINEVANRFVTAAEETGGFKKQIAATVETGLTGFGKVLDVMRGLQATAKALEIAFAGVGWVVNQTMARVAEAIGTTIDTTNRLINDLIQTANKLPGIELPTVEGSAFNTGWMKQLQGAADASSERISRLSGELGDLVDKPMPSENIDQYFAAVEQRSREASKAAQHSTDALRQPDGGGEGDSEQRKKEREKQREHLQKKMEQLRSHLQNRREAEVMDFQQRMEWLREAKNQEIITEQEYRKRKEELEAKHQQKLNKLSTENASYRERFEQQSMQSQIATVAGGFEQMFSAVRNQSKAMFRLYQAAAITNTVISTIESAQKAYAWGMTWGGPPLAHTFQAAAYGAGMARVAAISSQSFGSKGGATSGQTQGGTAVGQTGGGGGGNGGGGANREANINLMGGDQFSGDQIEQLAEKLNEFSGDNGDLKVNVRRAT